MKQTYTKKERNMYLAGMFGQNMIYNIIATGLVGYYFQFVLCIPAFAIGVIVAIARVWDAINDPMMGTIVDKTKSKWGKCRPYLIFAPIPIGIITILTFINGDYASAATNTGRILIVAWAGVSYIMWGMLYTIGDIPLWGLTSLMTEDEGDRSTILGLARVAAGIGAIGVLVVQIAQIAGGIFEGNGIPHAKAEKYGFIVVVIILTILSTIMFEFAGIGTKERVKTSEERHTFKENFQIMWQCKPFRQILISGILRSPIQLLMLIAISFVTYYFADGDFMNLFKDGIQWTMIINVLIIAVGIFAGQFIAMGIAPMLSKKIENKTLYNAASIGGAIPFALTFVVFIIFKGDVRSIVPIILTGLMLFAGSAAMGIINVMQSIMIADCVDYEEFHNGIRPDGVFFSGQSFITKLSGGIAAIIQAVVYGAIKFSDVNIAKMNEALAAGASFVTDYPQYAKAMFFLITIPPAIGMVLSAIPTLKYAMTDAEHGKMLDALAEKRAGNNAE